MSVLSRPARWALFSVVVLVVLVSVSGGFHFRTPQVDKSPQSPPQPRLAGLPLTFEVNQGQGPASVQYLARGPGYQILLSSTEAVFSLSPARTAQGEPGAAGHPHNQQAAPAVVRMALAKANPRARAEGLEPQTGVSHYLRGSDPKRWLQNIAHFGQVKYHQVYPGVDLVYYGNQRRLEYDFIVGPGRDPGQIALDFEGVKDLRVNDRGDLVLLTAHGELIQQRPVVYQQLDGRRQTIEAGYAVLDDRRVGFALGPYDHSRELVIDPVLAYSSFLGGNGHDIGYGIALDKAGNILVTGKTNSWDFPMVAPVQGHAVINDVFVSKYNANGSALVYSTYLGGSDEDRGLAIVVDDAGNAYVTGQTASIDFPTAVPFQAALNGLRNAFVSKLSPTGYLVYSTYLGVGAYDAGHAIAVDGAGNAYVTGVASSEYFPTSTPVLKPWGGGTDAFVSKFDPSGSSLLYSTYLGGNSYDAGTGIVVDGSGNAYVTGSTESSNFPLQAPRQATYRGGSGDAFVAKINATARALVYSTYLGGGGADSGNAIAVDAAGNAYVTGQTNSSDFPTAAPFQANRGGLSDGFVVKFNHAGSALVYGTYLGGSADDYSTGIAVDGIGSVYVTGRTYSGNFPASAPFQAPGSAGWAPDAFVSRFNPTGKTMVFSSGLGGSGGNEFGYGSAVDKAGNAWVIGATQPVDPDTVDFPTVAAEQAAPVWGSEAFLARIAPPTARAWQGDFDGNGKAEIFWRNTASGANKIWALANNTASSRTVASVAPGWLLAAVADFDGDHKSDVLWRNRSTGGNVIWRSANSLTSQAVAPVNLDWVVAGVGDFNADGKADLLWRDLTTGANVIWKSADKTTQQAVSAVGNLDWRVVGVGDFDGDGKADILWRKASTGENLIWRSATSQQAVTAVTNLAWDPVGIADFNGDGKADILWRDDRTDRNIIWKSAATQQAVAGLGEIGVRYGWFVVGVGDYDGDGKADILWRNFASGENRLWRSANSATPLNVPDIDDQAWSIVS